MRVRASYFPQHSASEDTMRTISCGFSKMWKYLPTLGAELEQLKYVQCTCILLFGSGRSWRVIFKMCSRFIKVGRWVPIKFAPYYELYALNKQLMEFFNFYLPCAWNLRSGSTMAKNRSLDKAVNVNTETPIETSLTNSDIVQMVLPHGHDSNV